MLAITRSISSMVNQAPSGVRIITCFAPSRKRACAIVKASPAVSTLICWLRVDAFTRYLISILSRIAVPLHFTYVQSHSFRPLCLNCPAFVPQSLLAATVRRLVTATARGKLRKLGGNRHVLCGEEDLAPSSNSVQRLNAVAMRGMRKSTKARTLAGRWRACG